MFNEREEERVEGVYKRSVQEEEEEDYRKVETETETHDETTTLSSP